MNNRKSKAPLWLVDLIGIFPLALAGLLFGGVGFATESSHDGFAAGGSSASLSKVDGATADGAPGKATLVSPTGTISTTTPTYVWNAVSNATYYYLWVDDSTGTRIKNWYTAAAAGCGSGTGTCSVTPSTTLALGVVDWWIQTWNPYGYGPWSDPMVFTLSSAGPPGKATLVSPTGTISTTTPTYVWNAVSNATWYYLWVDDSTGTRIKNWYTAAAAGCGSGTGTCSMTPSTALALGVVDSWIQTWNPYGYGPWSDPMVFTIAAVSRINLLTNPNAEDGIGSPSGDDVETIPGWTTTSNFTVVQYDAPTFPTVAESKRISGGKNFFAGGPNNDMSTATQVVDVSSSASAIDAGQRIAQLEAQLAGYDGQGDNAAVRAEFLSSSGTVLGWMQVGPVSATDDVFQLKTASGLVPAGTRSIRVTMISIRIDGNYNDGYFDNLYLGLAPKQ